MQLVVNVSIHHILIDVIFLICPDATIGENLKLINVYDSRIHIMKVIH